MERGSLVTADHLTYLNAGEVAEWLAYHTEARQVSATVSGYYTEAVLAGFDNVGKSSILGVVCDLAVAVGEAAFVPHSKFVVGVVARRSASVRFHGILRGRGDECSIHDVLMCGKCKKQNK